MHHAPHASLLLFGRDHMRYGRVHHEALTPDVAAAISVGGSPTSRSMLAKAEPNEDALAVIIADAHLIMAVADAHFGAEASHHFIQAIVARAPTTAASLIDCLEWALLADAETPSETTLTVVILERATGRGRGLSFGDSSAVIIDAEGARRLFEGNAIYVQAGVPGATRLATQFEFTLEVGALLALFTDGVDECHYRRPQTSIGMSHLHELFLSTRGDPVQFARRLGAKALNGVDENPGGEDNIALACARRSV